MDYKGYKVDKYPFGTAILELPFFLVTWAFADLEGTENDGYQRPFQWAIFFSALFYLLLGLLFLRRLLKLYSLDSRVIFLVQLMVALTTPLTNYANYDASFSHVYSFFAITAFLYYSKSFFLEKNPRHFLLAALLLGLILILRQVNLIIILFLPYLAGSYRELKESFLALIRRPGLLLSGFILTLAVFSIQAFLWYQQTGVFLVRSYPGEGFNFLDPKFFKVLFSYKKGLFVYTPLLFISLLSIIWFIHKKYYYLAAHWAGFFIALSYLISSWWNWYYGHSFGSRAYLDFLAVLILPLAVTLQESGRRLKSILILVSVLALLLNIIQTYQYKHYILHYISMDREKYWDVFLRTDRRFRGIFWHEAVNPDNYRVVKEIPLGDQKIEPRTGEIISTISSNDIEGFENVSLIQVMAENEYPKSNDSEIILGINNAETSENYYWHNRYLIHFNQEGFNKMQEGLFNFRFNPVPAGQEWNIVLESKGYRKSTTLQNLRIGFLERKEKP